MSKEIIEGLKESKKQAKKHHYLGLSVAIVSIINGYFYINFAGLLSFFFRPYIEVVPEVQIGYVLMFVGIMKLYGIVTGNTMIRRIAIVLLSGIWGGLAFVSLIYSFGVGFPSLWFVYTGKIAADCMRISIRGFFSK